MEPEGFPAEIARSRRHPVLHALAVILAVLLDNWYLSHNSATCSRYAGDQLAAAYVAYWRERGLGLFAGFLRTAESSADEFLDGAAEPCPVPNPRVNPL